MANVLEKLGIGVLRVLAYILLGLAAILAFLTVLVAFDPKTGFGSSAFLGMLMFVAIAGIPGGLLWRYVRKHADQARFELQLTGFIRSRDRIPVEELARWIGRTPAETDGLLREHIATGAFDLVFHRSSGHYIHRARLAKGARALTQCPSCGGQLSGDVLLADESETCRYCGQTI